MGERDTDDGVMMIGMPEPEYLMGFHDPDGNRVGVLDWNEDGKLFFEGDVDASAAIFFSTTCQMFNDYWERRMTRDGSGKILPQCEATYILKDHTVHCVKEKNHGGEHADARGSWNEATARAEPEAVPATAERGRDGDIGGGDSS